MIRQCQQLYETILLGQTIGILEGYKETDLGEGGTVYSIIDGHQRISAILDFVDNKVKTWTYAQKLRVFPNARPPVEPGLFFKQVSNRARNHCLDYRFYINLVPRGSDLEMAERFLGIQCQTPLTSAEKLYAYPSVAKDAARELAHHPFWEDFYLGETNRGQLFQSSLYLLTLEMVPGVFVDLGQGRFVAALASGKYDAEVTAALIARVNERLEEITCVFSGMQFSDRSALIVMYQAVLLLRQAEYIIRSQTDRGRLTPWFSTLLLESKRAVGNRIFRQPLHKLLYASGQQEFWMQNEQYMLSLFGVIRD